jgi:UDP-galactopyranose mutase
MSDMPDVTQELAARRSPGGQFDWLVVGAGFAGSVLAERLASQRGEKVLVIDRRDHIGGNAYDHLDEAGLLIHRYGPHIFHTNSEQIFAHLSKFTAWRPYEHRVLAQVRSPTTGEDTLVPIPINLDTINTLYGLNLTEQEVEGWMDERAEQVPQVRTSEDVVVGKVGRELYELFFRGYTRKQWALDPSELDKSVTARVPTRTNRDDRYFTDRFQYMPRDGYTAMFRRMLDHPNITVRVGMEFTEARKKFSFRRVVWTGPVDEYFGFRFGKLPYRSLRFGHETLDKEWALPTGTVNHPAEATPFTRVSEYKWMTGQQHPRTSVTYEFPSAEGDPYYPIPRPENQALYKKYEALADAEQDTWFVGRLATYRYYNMDQVVGQALATFERIEKAVPPAAANDDRALKQASAGD